MNSGRRYPEKTRSRAKFLRRAGLTHREIAKKIRIALGSAYLWTKGLSLSKEQKLAIQERRYKPTFY